MTMQINIGDHTSSQAGYIAFPSKHRPAIRWARTKAQWITRNLPAADTYFKGLPNGRTLTELLADSSIWVNFHPTMPHFGETNQVGGKEIAISITSLRIMYTQSWRLKVVQPWLGISSIFEPTLTSGSGSLTSILVCSSDR